MPSLLVHHFELSQELNSQRRYEEALDHCFSALKARVAARVLLGLAGAGIVVMSLAALTVLFSEEERPRAVGIWAAANFVSLPIGPILGGWLLTHFWWGWVFQCSVFLINVPVALVALIATVALRPESRAQERPGLDLVGVALSVLGLVALIYGLIQAGQHGWSNAGAVPNSATSSSG